MTDLMCHPSNFVEWTSMLEHECEAVPLLPQEAAGTSAAGEPCKPGSEDGVHAIGNAGHSGMMRLAAHVVRDLARHRLLFKLLCHDTEFPKERPSTSRRAFAPQFPACSPVLLVSIIPALPIVSSNFCSIRAKCSMLFKIIQNWSTSFKIQVRLDGASALTSTTQCQLCRPENLRIRGACKFGVLSTIQVSTLCACSMLPVLHGMCETTWGEMMPLALWCCSDVCSDLCS
jgi:hypothetical protein